jgi:hypothetical protein
MEITTSITWIVMVLIATLWHPRFFNATPHRILYFLVLHPTGWVLNASLFTSMHSKQAHNSNPNAFFFITITHFSQSSNMILTTTSSEAVIFYLHTRKNPPSRYCRSINAMLVSVTSCFYGLVLSKVVVSR